MKRSLSITTRTPVVNGNVSIDDDDNLQDPPHQAASSTTGKRMKSLTRKSSANDVYSRIVSVKGFDFVMAKYQQALKQARSYSDQEIKLMFDEQWGFIKTNAVPMPGEDNSEINNWRPSRVTSLNSGRQSEDPTFARYTPASCRQDTPRCQ